MRTTKKPRSHAMEALSLANFEHTAHEVMKPAGSVGSIESTDTIETIVSRIDTITKIYAHWYAKPIVSFCDDIPSTLFFPVPTCKEALSYRNACGKHCSGAYTIPLKAISCAHAA